MSEQDPQRQISEDVSVYDRGRIGHMSTPSSQLPSLILTGHDGDNVTFLELFVRGIAQDPTGKDPVELIELVSSTFQGEKGSFDRTLKFIDALYLSERSYTDRYTRTLIDTLQFRQGLSPLNVWVWREATDSWEKVAPVD